MAIKILVIVLSIHKTMQTSTIIPILGFELDQHNIHSLLKLLLSEINLGCCKVLLGILHLISIYREGCKRRASEVEE